MSSPPTYPIPTLSVEAWPDPVIDKVGHDVRSQYVERFWLGILGPSATWLLRRLVSGLEEQPDGFELDLALTASELGLGNRSGRHSPFFRSIDRCCRFGVAHQIGERTLRVRRKLPPLTRMQIVRLAPALQDAHRRWTEGDAAGGMHEHREQARGLALSLLGQGLDRQQVELALHERHVHPALAHEAATWASDRRSRDVTAVPPRDAA